MLIKSSWCCGSISAGGVSVGFTNIVALLLGALHYFNQLTTFSITIIVIVFGCLLLLLANALLIYGSVKTKPGFLLPWLVLYVLGTLALVIYMGVCWAHLGLYKAISIGAVLCSFYFCALVTELYHHLRREKQKKVVTEEPDGGGVGVERQDGTLLLDIDHTDVQNTPPLLFSSTVSDTDSSLPRPEEIINVPAVAFNPKNPFLTDIFKTDSSSTASNGMKHKVSDINADFTPFKSVSSGGEVPKIKIFLPKSGDGDSDIDFSFDDSKADFSFNESTNMCKIEEDGK